jgi:hypothetical protein
MKFVLKTFFNETFIIIISFLLYIIGILYSNDPGFYSRELLSSGGDDFYIFIGMTKINIFGIIFGSINLIINIFLVKHQNKVINISFIIYIEIFIMQLISLLLINLDTSLVYVFFTFDLFSLWFSIYIIGTIILILSKKLIKNINSDIHFIEIKIIHKIFIISGFIILLFLLLFINTYLIKFMKPVSIEILHTY